MSQKNITHVTIYTHVIEEYINILIIFVDFKITNIFKVQIFILTSFYCIKNFIKIS